MDEQNQIKAAATARNPAAELESLIRDLKDHYHLSDEETAQARADYTQALTTALKRREKMTELWPDAPAACFIYASFCRPFSEYGRAPESVRGMQHQPADWPASIPHSYIASAAPLELPQVELLRFPLT
ncbi:hypothetical protein [Deinococcus fonticola]|uniref:hypothetical protein n=1 Tax=Deinococcus fonticola TaxID=2528713 RepID=UPI00107532AE|nr:hypothetical protein [Deinococcus fonticola]